jgi:hypothetical protein
MTVNVRQIDSRSDRRKFVNVPWRVNENNRDWVPPLKQDVLDSLNQRKNPFFEHGEAALFLAEQDGRPVGRTTAHTNRLHNDYHKDKTGFFGFFECVEDEARRSPGYTPRASCLSNAE